MTIHDTLKDRNSIHGNWADNARVYRRLVEIMENEPGWQRLTDCQKSVLHMDAMKTARILTGNPAHADHWHDKAGYAMLAEQSLKPVDDKARANGIAAVATSLARLQH